VSAEMMEDRMLACSGGVSPKGGVNASA